MSKQPDTELAELASELTIVWLSIAYTRPLTAEVPAFLRATHVVLPALDTGRVAPEPLTRDHRPPVTVRKSLASSDQIISPHYGKPHEGSLRHLPAHGRSSERCRERYKLMPNYPRVAKCYNGARRATAERNWIARRPAQTGAMALLAAAPTPRRRFRGGVGAADAE